MNLELAISINYVKEWGFKEAIRELIQNCLDQSHINPNNEMLFKYDADLQILEIGNKDSTLDVSTLVLGNTSKDKSPELVGKFGEGYKLALIVLLRMGKAVTIFNNPMVWTPSIKHSEQFNSPVLNINVVKYRFKSIPEHHLVFKITGVTQEEYDQVVEHTLHFHDVGDHIQHDYGRILLEEKYKGHVYVNGLYVSFIKDAAYGYDIKPNHLNIGRDRDLVNQFDVFYKTSYMWASQKEHLPIIQKMLVDEAMDIQYIDHHVYKVPKYAVRHISDCWWKEHGSGAIPCATQKDADKARLNNPRAKVVIVSEQLLAILKQSDQYSSFSSTKQVTQVDPHKLVLKLMKHKQKLPSSVLVDFEALLEMSKYWGWK